MKTMTTAMLTLALAVPALAQERAGSERIEVDVVLVDATVTDRSGAPIIGLTAEDFVVTEDGQPVEIESVDYFTSRRLVSGDAGGPANIDEVKDERWFILFFQRYPGISEGLSDLMRARREASRWVAENMLPSDRVAVVGYDVRLRVYSDFTNDPEVLRKAINESATFAKGLTERPPYAGEHSLFETLDAHEIVNRTGRVYDAFELLARAVQPIRARKIMVVYSQGFSEGDLARDNVYMVPAIDALNRANVQTWTAELPGLPDDPYRQNLSRLALDTGGEPLRNPVNYATVLRNADRANAGYYLLTYRSPAAVGPGEHRSIKVTLRNPEFRVSARPGYGSTLR